MNFSLALSRMVLTSLVFSSIAKAQESASNTNEAPRMIAVQMRVLELDEAKLRKVGIDYEIVDDRVKFSLMAGRGALPLSFPTLLVKEGLAKEVDSPSLALRTNGQPAQFLVGGETPVRYYKYIMYKKFGTVVDITATSVDDTHVHVDIDYRWTTIDMSKAPALPSFPSRRCQTSCDMKLGQRSVLPVDVTPTEGKQAKPTVMLILVEEHESPIAGTSP
jgi:hypothetical protein